MARCCRGAFSGCLPRQDYALMRSRALDDGKMHARCALRHPTVAGLHPDAFLAWLAVAIYLRGASSSALPWQDYALMRSRVSIRGKIPPRCVPGRQSVASFALHASQKRPRTRKEGLRGKIRAPCIRKRAGFGRICAPCIRKALQTAVWEYTARRSCQEGALFAAQAPRIMHGAQILPFLGAPFERFDLFRVGWGGARGSRTALALYGGGARGSRTVPVCAGWRGCFVGSLSCSFELLPASAQDALVVAPAFA